ncbi:MAG: hypothetical protein ABEJ56_03610 [Candidatus Nanohaloarchaea archaeon]
MNKFWIFVSFLLMVGIILNLGTSSERIEFTDLETECQYERQSGSSVELENRKLSFEGHFPVENPETELSYRYQLSDGRINLDVVARNESSLTDFFDNCRSVAVYDAETARIDPGRYLVELAHDGKQVHTSIVRID